MLTEFHAVKHAYRVSCCVLINDGALCNCWKFCEWI